MGFITLLAFNDWPARALYRCNLHPTQHKHRSPDPLGVESMRVGADMCWQVVVAHDSIGALLHCCVWHLALRRPHDGLHRIACQMTLSQLLSTARRHYRVIGSYRRSATFRWLK